jgi:hypothetical protein
LFTVSVKMQASAGEGYSPAMKQGKNSLHDRQRQRRCGLRHRRFMN